MNKEGRPRFSIAHRITVLFMLLFAAAVILSSFYFFSFVRAKYAEAEKQFWESAENSVSELNDMIRNLERHLVWVASNAEETAIWDSDTPYEKLLFQKKIMSELRNFLLATEGAEAIVVAQRNSDIILERHTMSDQALLRMLNIYNGRQSIVPISPGVFAERENGNYSHLIFSYPIYTGMTRNLYYPIAANIYAAVRAESMLPRKSAEGIFYLCFRRGDDLISLADSAGGNMKGMAFSYPALSREKSASIDGEKYLQKVYPLNAEDFYMICFWRQNYLFEQMAPILIQGIALLAVLLLLILVGNRILRQNLQQPTDRMLKDVERIRQGDFNYRLASGEAMEFSEISESINTLLDDLDAKNREVITHQKRLYELEILNRESRVLSLQAQINPHFLYNTLECVISMARYYRVPQITKIVSGIIRIYRYSASNNHFGTVESEFDCAENYGNVMNIRYENLFQFSFRSDPELLSAEMPRMIIQPLVENAVQHGMLSTMRSGTIETAAVRDGGDLVITVRDDGIGIPADALEEIRNDLRKGSAKEKRSGSIGLMNVHSRIVNEYGEGYGLTIDSGGSSGTMVTMRMPIRGGRASDDK